MARPIPKVRKKKSKTYAQLKREADRVFSIWVRQRGAVQGLNECVSCGITAPWQKLQAGHWITRGRLSTRWDIANVWPQCYRCNVALRGNYPAYAMFMAKHLGFEELDRLDKLSKQPTKLNRSDLEALIERYSVGHSQDRCVDPGASKG